MSEPLYCGVCLADGDHTTDVHLARIGADSTAVITPEQQLRNVAAILQQHTQVVRPGSTSRNQRPGSKPRVTQYAADRDTIAGTARQLADMVMAYLDGTLTAMPDDGEPF